MDTGHPTNLFLIAFILPMLVAATLVVISLVFQDVELNGCTEQLTALCESYNDSKFLFRCYRSDVVREAGFLCVSSQSNAVTSPFYLHNIGVVRVLINFSISKS